MFLDYSCYSLNLNNNHKKSCPYYKDVCPYHKDVCPYHTDACPYSNNICQCHTYDFLFFNMFVFLT